MLLQAVLTLYCSLITKYNFLRVCMLFRSYIREIISIIIIKYRYLFDSPEIILFILDDKARSVLTVIQ